MVFRVLVYSWEGTECRVRVDAFPSHVFRNKYRAEHEIKTRTPGSGGYAYPLHYVTYNMYIYIHRTQPTGSTQKRVTLRIISHCVLLTSTSFVMLYFMLCMYVHTTPKCSFVTKEEKILLVTDVDNQHQTLVLSSQLAEINNFTAKNFFNNNMYGTQSSFSSSAIFGRENVTISVFSLLPIFRSLLCF